MKLLTQKNKSCGCKCKLDKDTCNNKQIWNKDTCKCECRKINAKLCGSGFIWNPSVCICECNKYCDIYEYLDHKSCICKSKMAESLTEKCEKNINETLDISSSNDNNKTSNSCTVYSLIFCIFNNKYIYDYLCLLFSLIKK